MSVTFYTQSDPSGWALSCSCGDAFAVSRYADYADARSALAVGVRPSCGDIFCADYPVSTVPLYAVEPVSVNVSSVNARHLLEVLGYESIECVGSSTADDFFGRVLIAQGASLTDAGIPATQNGNVVDCGREEGYTDSRLIDLEMVARHAVDHKLCINWG
jgi:hypothetical protein